MARYKKLNGQFVLLSAEENATRDAERNALLAETDYLALSDVTMSSAWTTYRQNLRDIPAQSGFPNDEGYTVTYPTKPS